MRDTILIVDDEEVNRIILEELFSERFAIIEAENGQEAIDILDKSPDRIAGVLLDIVMPLIDGFGVLEHMRKRRLTYEIPVLMITGETAMEQKQRGYDLGVIDYITKPFEAYVVRRRVQNVVDLYYHRSNLELTAKSQAKRLREQYLKLNSMNEKIVNTLGTIVEFRNMESGLHVLRMKEFTRILIEYIMDNYSEYLLTKDDVDAIVYAAAMHDIGKIHVSDAILLKPDSLTVDEFESVKVHTTKGADMLRELSTIDDPVYLRYCSEIALSHHERFDGRGYPNGLWGNEIPISAQVVSLVDVYDALVSKRVYKEAYSKEESFDMIMDEQCGVFNPKLLDAFEFCRDKIEEKSDKLV